MAVLPKYALKQLFEKGDLITQSSLYDLIDATYNPTLVGGTNITLNQVITPSGTTITINAICIGTGAVTSVTGLNSTFVNTVVTNTTTTPIVTAKAINEMLPIINIFLFDNI